jgi:PAS domain S-box-containing protein
MSEKGENRPEKRSIAQPAGVERALRDREEIYHQIIENLNEGIWVIDKDAYTTFANTSMANMLGYTVDEMMGRHLFSFMDEKGVEIAKANLERRRSGIKEHHDFEFLRKDGTKVLAILGTSPIHDEENNYIGAVAAVLDVTERIQMEKALQESEKRYKELFDNLKSGVVVYAAVDNGSDFVFRDFNKAVERIEKISRKNLLGKRLLEAFPKAREFGILDVLQTVWRTGKPQYLPAKLYKDERIEGWRENYIYKLPSGEIISVYEDISEKKKAEAIIRNERLLLYNILSSMQEGVYIINSDFDFEFTNSALEDEFGSPAGRKCYEYFHDLAHPCPWCDIDKILNGETVRWESYFKQTNKTYDLISTPIINADGSVSKLEIFRDISERKRDEELLKRDKDIFEKLVGERSRELLLAQKKLEQARRLSDIGTLAATVAHELRNPLGVIQTAAYNIRRKRKNTAIDKNIDNIEKKVSESSRIIDNLLGYAKIKMPRHDRINIAAILDDCTSSVKKIFCKQKCTIISNLEPIRKTEIQADPLQIREVFDNILNNAYQSIEDRAGTIRIHGDLGTDGFIVIRIEDNGAGIAEEDMKRVFEPFFTRKSKGTGLGLAICKELIDLHNGRIRIESELGKGTSIIVSLPADSSAT